MLSIHALLDPANEVRVFRRLLCLGVFALQVVVFHGCDGGDEAAQTGDASQDSSDLDGDIRIPDTSETEDFGDVNETCEPVELPPERTNEPVDVRFSLNRDTVLDSHVFVPTALAASGLGYGGGGALIDFNDDGLVDVFLGQRHIQGTAPCLYINESTEAETKFRRFQCFPQLGPVAGARTVDVDDDGDFELLTYGEAQVNLLDFNARVEISQVMSLDDIENDCAIYAAIEHPTETGAIVVAFGPFEDADSTRSGSESTSCQPVTVALTSSGYGAPVFWSDTPFSPVTLALGRADIDQDGVLDTAIIVDTFSNPNVRNTGRHPGGFLRGTPAGGEEASVFIPWVAGSNRAWGSFMGAAQIALANTVYTVLTDWGTPLLRDPNTSTDEGQSLLFDFDSEPFPFSWSPIVADFNLDGRDDLLLTRGDVPGSSNGGSDEADILLLQTDDGFSELTGSSWLLSHPSAYDDETNIQHLSRAGVVTDFDRDGRLEVLIMPYEGRPLLYEAEAPTHCLAQVSSPYISGPNTLYGWSWLDSSGTAHPQRMDASMRLGDSQWLVLPAGNGVVRAPSGARIPYSCEPGDRIEVRETEWATIRNGSLRIEPCNAGMTEDVIDIRSNTVDGIDILSSNDHYEFPLTESPIRIFSDGRYALICSLVDGCRRTFFTVK